METRNYTDLLRLAVHVAAVLEAKNLKKAIQGKAHNCLQQLCALGEAHRSATGNQSGWDPRAKARTDWNAEDIAYLTYRNRLWFMKDLDDGFAEEEEIKKKMAQTTLSLATLKLRDQLVTALDASVEQEPHLDLPPVFDKPPLGRCVGPVKLPAYVQALHMLEAELYKAKEEAPLTSPLRELANSRYRLVCKLKKALIADLFPTADDVAGEQGSRHFEIISDWHLRVVFD